jgi:hypothetical protein
LKLKITITLIFIFFFSFQNLKADGNDTLKLTAHEWRLGGEVFEGRIFKHKPSMAPIIERNAIGGEIFFSKQTDASHRWTQFFNYPEYGISYTFLDLGSPHYAGTAHCLFPYLNFYLFNNKNPLNLYLRMGTGFAYIEKIYNTEINPLNQAFSTHLNVVLNAKMQVLCRISNSWSVFAGAGITHLSNGAYQMPNFGMNVIGFFSGISHSFGEEKSLTAPTSKPNVKNKNWDCSVFLMAGIKEINPIGGKKYFTGDFNVELTKRHLPYTRFGVSLDITHDASEYDCIVFQSLPAVDRLKTTRIGLSGGYTLLFGDLSLGSYLGTYLHESNPLYGRIYQRTSLRYPLSDRLKLSITLRNHKGKADYIGFGFGYRLTK